MREVPLSTFGLETVGSACARKGWAAKTVQNWVRAELLSVVPVGSGRGTFLLLVKEVDAFAPPPRGRPPLKAKKGKAKK